jgi:hypothetical protein
MYLISQILDFIFNMEYKWETYMRGVGYNREDNILCKYESFKFKRINMILWILEGYIVLKFWKDIFKVMPIISSIERVIFCYYSSYLLLVDTFINTDLIIARYKWYILYKLLFLLMTLLYNLYCTIFLLFILNIYYW